METRDTPFHWRSLAEVGLTPKRLRRELKEGTIRRVCAGVYVATSTPDSLALRAEAASVALPEHAVVCDRSAAWLWGVDVHDPDERFVVPDLEVSSLRGNVRTRRPGMRGGVRDLVPGDVVELSGVAVTTPARTALDLACLHGRFRALATLDEFMRVHGVTRVEYLTQIARFAGRRGVIQARELVPLATALSESTGESWCRLAIIDAGLGEPTSQVEVSADGMLARLDLAYEHLLVAVEYDGEEFHGPEHAARDAHRRRWLKKLGWHVIVVRKHQLRGPAREEWLRELALIIDERTHRHVRRFARGA